MQRWVACDGVSRLLLAAASQTELRRRGWPEQVRVSRSKALGRRVAARGSRRILVAFWPDDGYEATRQPSLICVVRGRAVMGIADYKLHCQAGDFLLIPQGVPLSHQSHSDPDDAQSQCDILWIRPGDTKEQLHCWICHSQAQLHESGPQYGACWIQSAMLGRLFLCLNEELEGANDARLTHHLLACLLGMLEREILQGKAYLPRHHVQENSGGVTSAKSGNTIAEACQYISEHLDRSLTASQIARYACISQTLFHTKFRASTGQTFQQYLTTQRLAKASALLRDSDLPVNAISAAVGLHYSQLRRLFMQHYRCTPGKFRKRHLQSGSSD